MAGMFLVDWCGLAQPLRPLCFESTKYRIWRSRARLWLSSMGCFYVIEGKPAGMLTPEQVAAFEADDNLFRGAVLSVLGENIVDSFMNIPVGEDMWEALENKFGVLDVASQLHIVEQLCDYMMVDARSVVEQAGEVHSLAIELENFKCVLPDEFVADVIIAKLPPSWRKFATSLKHERRCFSLTYLIESLVVEENVRSTNSRARGNKGDSGANMVYEKSSRSQKFKNKNMPGNKVSRSTRFWEKKLGK